MKKLAFAVAFASWAGFASAGDYHVNAELKCSQCHTMHASRQHGFNAGTQDSNFPVADQTGVGNPRLLTYPTVNRTCLACHDGNSHLPDVFGADAGGTFNRSAGALNGTVGDSAGKAHTVGAAIDTLRTGYQDWMGHTMGTTAQPPGMPATITWGTGEFECSDCHAVHGNISYRNLGNSHGRVGITAPTISYTHAATPNATYDVTITNDAAPFATANVSFGAGSAMAYKGVTTTADGMNQFCASCHGNFHGTANIADAAGEYIKHPTSGVAYAATNLIGGAQTALTRPLWTDAAQTAFDVGCLTCHKGHGNARGYGLLYPGNMTEGTTYTGATNKSTLPGNAAIVDYEQGDASISDPGMSYASYPIRNLCATCHSQSRTLRQ